MLGWLDWMIRRVAWRATRPLRILRHAYRRHRGHVTVTQQIAYIFDVPERLL